jgi:DNA-binding HxlR family transcriptional regulator
MEEDCKILPDIVKACPINNTFEIIGKKFTIHILRNLNRGQTRFSQFLESIEGMNPKTLSARLREMEKNGLIERTVIPGIPVQIEYTITERGKDLKPVLQQMAEFSMRHFPKTVFKDGKSRTFKEAFSKQS